MPPQTVPQHQTHGRWECRKKLFPQCMQENNGEEKTQERRKHAMHEAFPLLLSELIRITPMIIVSLITNLFHSDIPFKRKFHDHNPLGNFSGNFLYIWVIILRKSWDLLDLSTLTEDFLKFMCEVMEFVAKILAPKICGFSIRKVYNRLLTQGTNYMLKANLCRAKQIQIKLAYRKFKPLKALIHVKENFPSNCGPSNCGACKDPTKNQKFSFFFFWRNFEARSWVGNILWEDNFAHNVVHLKFQPPTRSHLCPAFSDLVWEENWKVCFSIRFRGLRLGALVSKENIEEVCWEPLGTSPWEGNTCFFQIFFWVLKCLLSGNFTKRVFFFQNLSTSKFFPQNFPRDYWHAWNFVKRLV